SHYWEFSESLRIITIVIFGILSLMTIHTSTQAAFVNYDNATEFLVYAHSARGPKDVLAQIEEISRRTTGGLGIKIAYDNETTYPFWWYLRNYPNQVYYEQNPTRELRDAPIILVGEENYGKLEPVVGQAYYKFDFIRLWWPNQDYFDLTWQRINDALRNPQMRQALVNIWLYRDYTLYGQLTNKDMSLTNWYPSSRMRMYIRKDVISQLWNYGSIPVEANVPADPYEGKQLKIEANKIIGTAGTEPGQFQHPHDLAIAKDGSLYIVDTDNNRIQHLSPDGQVLQVWGNFGDSTTSQTPGGTFNQPWGIAIDQDGFIYVADTWNHRIQKFSAEGKFVKMWGYFGQGESPTAFWGPRDIAIDNQNRLFISDTGNKRIVVFDSEGNYLSSFGQAGMQPGEFDEPVGLAFAPNGQLYVADTWNQRVQVFSIDENLNFSFVTSWDIYGWYGQSLDNKPYIAIDQNNHVFITDPEAYRILEFTGEGNFIRYFGDFSQGADGFNLPTSIAIDQNGGLWISDTGNNRIMHFTLP
ncbi:MAG: NHL repeat-containing protein, partial [Anaerolineales bacterium]